MSGIAGIIHFDGAPADLDLISQMTAAMPYRGPDGINHWVKGPVALGQCMLCTTPESLEETQPWPNEDESLVLVMDGRVDNWEELRKELLGRGARLRNRSDAELVLRAYEIWGDDCPDHIDGDFALAIWNARERTVFCARDRVGNKPFHYHWDGKRFVFASELHTILDLPWVKQELNEGMVAEFLAIEWYSRDETFWQGIRRLVAAHRMKVDTNGPKLDRYWFPDLSSVLSYKRDEEYVEHYRDLFTDIVRRMSRSHKPLACDVSGGLDSSAIFAIAENLHQQHKLLSPSVEGYTLDFHDDADANELEYAHAVGEYWGKKIREVKPSLMPASWYQDWTRHYHEFPAYPNFTMNMSLRSEALSRGSRVVLLGLGGDEWLTGNRTYYADLLANREWAALVQILKRDSMATSFSRSVWYIVRYGLFFLLPDSVITTLRDIKRASIVPHTETSRHSWLTRPLKAQLDQRRQQYHQDQQLQTQRPGSKSFLIKLESPTFTTFHELEERMTGSRGMERRLPFWDTKMIQFAFSLPAQHSLKGNVGKALHRSAMKGFLPELVLERTTKAEFSIAFRSVMTEINGQFNKDEFSKRAAWVDLQEAEKLWQDYNRGDRNGIPDWRLWALFGCHHLADLE